MRDIKIVDAARFKTNSPATANMPDADWHLNFAELMEQFRRLGAHALAKNGAPDLLKLADTITRRQKSLFGQRELDATIPCQLKEMLHEFAAFSAPNSRDQTVVDCALHQMDALPGCVQAYLSALGATAWELYEIVAINPRPRAQPGEKPHATLELRRLYDDASIMVAGLESSVPARLGDVAGWRIFDADGFMAASKPLPVPAGAVAPILSQLNLEFSKWTRANRRSRSSRRCELRRDYMRARGNFLLLNHCIRAMSPRLCVQVEPPAIESVDTHASQTLVSPSETDLPGDCWRRLGQAFSVLEVSAAGQSGIEFPHRFEVVDDQILSLEAAADSWVATLFDSLSAYNHWRSVQRTLARPKSPADTYPQRVPATPQLRSWRARSEQLGARDIRFLQNLHLKPLTDGAALGVRLDADWRWHDLDHGAIDRLIEALHIAAKQLRTGEGLAA